MILLDGVLCAGCHRSVVVHRARSDETPYSRNPDGTMHGQFCGCDCGCEAWICGYTGWYMTPRKTDRCLPCLRGLHQGRTA